MDVKNLKHALVAWVLGGLVLAVPAQAAIPGIPEDAGADDGAAGDLACTVQSGGDVGERHCSGIFTTFDGAPIDVNVGFPQEPATGPDGDFPVIGVFHGWGGSKLPLTGTAARQCSSGSTRVTPCSR